MSVNENITTGRKYRVLVDEASKLWQRISFWHKASDCEFDDGQNAEEKLGAIKGITTDLSVTETGYAADMSVVSEINSNLQPVVLWQNPNPAVGFSAQTIILSSDKYTELLFIYIIDIRLKSLKTEKIPSGYGTSFSNVSTSGGGSYVAIRSIEYVDSVTFYVGNATDQYSTSGGKTNNNILVPYQIIGYK